jgi:ceramide glucosyltransferase
MASFFSLQTGLAWLFIAASVLGSLYQLLAAFAIWQFAHQPTEPPALRPAVTLLKPLCGGEAELYENLRSFCVLDYPEIQIVFGVRDPDDAAIPVVERLRAEFPAVDIALVVNPNIYGTNYKVSNLINMFAEAKHDLLVLSDSDMRVGPGYLDAIAAGLERPGAGIVTCLYLGQPMPGLWSALGAAGINYWFLPSAAVSKLLGGKVGCYGATIALRRETLAAIGGFAAVRNQLADDYALGALVRERGLDVVVIPCFPTTTVDEPGWRALFQHELRWARTIRNTAPAGFAGTAITHPLPLALLAVAAGLVAGWGWPMLIGIGVASVLSRAVLIACVRSVLGAPKPRWWLLLPRDVLSLVILVLAFCGRSVSWRASAFRVDSVGALSEETDGI